MHMEIFRFSLYSIKREKTQEKKALREVLILANYQFHDSLMVDGVRTYADVCLGQNIPGTYTGPRKSCIPCSLAFWARS